MYAKAIELSSLNESKTYHKYQLLLETIYKNDNNLYLKYSILAIIYKFINFHNKNNYINRYAISFFYNETILF